MTARQLADRIGNLDDDLIQQASDSLKRKRSSRKLRRILPLAAAVIAVLALCGFALVQLGLYDRWLQEPSSDPIQVVRSAIENQAEKDYTLTVRVDEITIDEAETERIIKRYTGSDLAASRGWSDEYLQEHFVVVQAKYYVEYDHTKTFLDDGNTVQFFYLVQDVESGEWTITDNT
ncbi:MAG: hypothetical protein ACI3XJ_05310 [Oscillospiraceae bacterium]